MSESRRYIAIQEDKSLIVEREPIPSPGQSELLLKVCAAGVNRADVLQRAGHYPPPPDASPIMGLEVSGEVVAVGEGVAPKSAGGWDVGDQVCTLTHGAGYCDYTTVPASQCMPLPPGVSLEDAAGLPEALLTVWHNVFQRANLKVGERFLVHGGSSGIGTMAIQMAKAAGAQVYTTAGSHEKCDACSDLGADVAIDYNASDYVDIIHQHTEGAGVNVILDMVGGDYVERNFKVAAAEGRIVNIAFMRGFKAEVNFAHLLMKRLVLTGSTLRAQSFEQKAIMVAQIRETVFPWFADGFVKPVIDSRFELKDAARAHERMQSSAHVGKILLTM